jgi:hypothetical protein
MMFFTTVGMIVCIYLAIGVGVGIAVVVSHGARFFLYSWLHNFNTPSPITPTMTTTVAAIPSARRNPAENTARTKTVQMMIAQPMVMS